MSTPPSAPASAQGPAPEDVTSLPPDLAQIVGQNVRRLRRNHGHSLEALAKLAGVSRAMLSQIEGGRSMPTIGMLWKIARGLDCPFAALMRSGGGSGVQVLRNAEAKLLTSRDGGFASRALFPFDAERQVEFYELTLQDEAVEDATPHPPGTTENLTVSQGTVEIVVEGERHRLETGDSILFEADVPHSYRNVEKAPAVMYLVMTYVKRIG